MPGEFIPPFRSPAADAETVRANWPRYADAPAILPYGDLWKPIPWGMVKAVNLVRGHLVIREEGFLEDVGGPKPNPRPQDVHKPAPAGETEKKGWSNSGRLLLFYRAVRKAWHKLDESLEKVDILYDSLPGWVRLSLSRACARSLAGSCARAVDPSVRRHLEAHPLAHGECR